MAHIFQVCMHGVTEKLPLVGNTISKSSLKSAFLLTDKAIIRLSYELNGDKFCCLSQTEPEPSFLLPEQWPHLQFTMESDQTRSRPSTSSDMTAPQGSPPSAKRFVHWMFYLNEHTKSTAICIHQKFFITFRHGSHRRFNVGDQLNIYKADDEVNEQTGIEVRVVKTNEPLDFILLKSKTNVVDRKPSFAQVEESEPYIWAGFGNETGSLSYLPGTIHSVRRHYFSGVGPFVLGTSASSLGDSGGGIWSAKGFIGMRFGCSLIQWKNHEEAFAETAILSPKNIIIPAFHFEMALMEEVEKERKESNSPPKKKSCHVTEIDGKIFSLEPA